MKSEKTIHNAVRTESGIFKPGDEDALAKAVSPEEIQRLTDAGAISGYVAPKEEKKAKK